MTEVKGHTLKGRKMARIQIAFRPDQIETINREADFSGVSFAEVVRKAVDFYRPGRAALSEAADHLADESDFAEGDRRQELEAAIGRIGSVLR